eukprot:scaffold53842_cov84-Attheya_sp.AAC.1
MRVPPERAKSPPGPTTDAADAADATNREEEDVVVEVQKGEESADTGVPVAYKAWKGHVVRGSKSTSVAVVSWLGSARARAQREAKASSQEQQQETSDPRSMRRMKTKSRNFELSQSQSQSQPPPPTKLHGLCAQESVDLKEWLAVLREEPEASCVAADSDGRLPLHILADNDELLAGQSGSEGRRIATTCAIQLMRVYPAGITTLDREGRMPFLALMEDWMEWVYSDQNVHAHKQSHARKINELVGGAAGKIMKNVPGTSKSGNPMTERFRDEDEVGDVEMEAKQPKGGSSSSPKPVKMSGNDTASPNASKPSFPKVVLLWEEVEWCFEMLSFAFEQLTREDGSMVSGSNNNNEEDEDEEPSVARRTSSDELARHIAKRIPLILQTILLLEDVEGNVRQRVIKMTFFQRLLLCSDTVGPWMTKMLRRQGLLAKRAVDYMSQISQITAKDYYGSYRTVLKEDRDHVREKQIEIFQAVDALEGTMASLVTLDEKELERAGSTAVAWFIMSKTLTRPFVVSLVVIDFVLQFTLLLAFRTESYVDEDGNVGFGAVSFTTIIFICVHDMIRKTVEALSLLSYSISVFRRYFISFAMFFHLLTTVLTIVAVLADQKNPETKENGLNALVIGLLWYKVLVFLKVANKQMSTFILALFQILKDLRSFAVVLVVVIFMFGDMFYISVSTKDNGQFCTDGGTDLSGPAIDFCDSSASSYLRMYALLLGDFELNDYKDTTAMTILFIVFTLFGVVILLNMLIAVVSDSYERAKISSLLLFGRARVGFVAQNEALEGFLKPKGGMVEHIVSERDTSVHGALALGTRIGRWCIFIALITTAFAAEVFLVSQSIYLIQKKDINAMTVVLWILCLILTLALWVMVNYAFKEMIRSFTSPNGFRLYQNFNWYPLRVVKAMGRRIFGISKSLPVNQGDAEEVGGADEEWTGRLSYMEKSFKNSLEDTKAELIDEIIALEKRLYEHEDRTKNIN